MLELYSRCPVCPTQLYTPLALDSWRRRVEYLACAAAYAAQIITSRIASFQKEIPTEILSPRTLNLKPLAAFKNEL